MILAEYFIVGGKGPVLCHGRSLGVASDSAIVIVVVTGSA